MKTLIKLLMQIWLLAVFSSLMAQTWSPLEMHAGGKVTGIIGHPTNENILFCRTDVAGIYKSINKGENWTQLLLNVPKFSDHIFKPRSLAVNPSNENELFFASGNSPTRDSSGIWKSTDGGVSWELKSELAAFSGNGIYRWADEVLVYKPTNTSVLFVGAQPKVVAGTPEKGGVFFSTNSGDSWRKINTTIFDDKWITKLLFDPENDDILYIAVANPNIAGLFPAGGLWSYNLISQEINQLTNYEVVDVDFDAVNKNIMLAVGDSGISVSNDKGVNWTFPTKPFGYTYTSFVTPHPTEANHWFFGGANGFFSNGFVETTDGLVTTQFTTYGAPNSVNYNKITWPSYAAANTNTQPVFGGALSNFYFNPLNSSTAYFNNIWRCDNATGSLVDRLNSDKNSNANWNWRFTAKGIYIMVGIRVSAHPTNEDRYTLNVADVNQYETLDNGGDMLYYGLMQKLNYSAVTKYFHGNDAIRYSGGVDNLGNGTLNKTIDGVNWVEMASGFFDGSKVIQDLQIDPLNSDIVIVGLENKTLTSQMYRSNDGGANWMAWDTGVGDAQFFKKWEGWSRLLQDSDGDNYYVWNTNKLFKRGINDASWREILLPLTIPIRRITTAKNKPGSLYLVYNQSNQLYISNDYGDSWNSYSLPFSGDSEFVSASPNGRVIVARRFNFNMKREFKVWINDAVESGALWAPVLLTNHPTTTKNMTFINETRVISVSRGHGSYLAEIPISTLNSETFNASTPVYLAPNPSEDNVTILFNDKFTQLSKTVSVVDYSGREVYFTTVKSSGAKLNLKTSTLSSGLYFINITSEAGENYSCKLIKK